MGYISTWMGDRFTIALLLPLMALRACASTRTPLLALFFLHISSSRTYISLISGFLLQTEGTVKPFPNFNAEHDAAVLRKAMKGLGELL